MTGKCFLDSNAWVYFFTPEDQTKHDIIKRFVKERQASGLLFTSWQIINEVWRTLLRKNVRGPVAREMAEFIYTSCERVDFSFDLLELAHELRSRHSVSYWDSLVVAAAMKSDCRYLISEDMQDGRWFDNTKISNIFHPS